MAFLHSVAHAFSRSARWHSRSSRTVVMLGLLTGCGASERPSAASASIDTLPGGIVRVSNLSPADSGRWSLVLERTVQPADESAGALRNPDDILLLDDGSLIVSDTKPASVMRFDPSGHFGGTIGREGGGPGEYRSAYVAAHGDTLVIHDPTAARATMFSLTNNAVQTQRATTPRYYSTIRIDGSGRVVTPTLSDDDSVRGPRQGYLRFSLNGATVDTAMIPERKKGDRRWIVRDAKRIIFETLVPFQPRDIHTPDPLGGFVTGWSGEYALRATRNGADTVRVIRRMRSNEPVNNTEKAAMVEAKVAEMKSFTSEALLRSGMVASAIPDTRPSFDQIAVDPAGRIWVRLSQRDSTTVRFDLFDHDGRWLDTITVPQAGWNRDWWHPVSYTRDRVAVIHEDEEGKPAILVYKIVRRDK